MEEAEKICGGRIENGHTGPAVSEGDYDAQGRAAHAAGNEKETKTVEVERNCKCYKAGGWIARVASASVVHYVGVMRQAGRWLEEQTNIPIGVRGWRWVRRMQLTFTPQQPRCHRPQVSLHGAVSAGAWAAAGLALVPGNSA